MPIPSSQLRLSAGNQAAFMNFKKETVYKVKGYSLEQRSTRAAAILKRALNEGAVIFELPISKMSSDLVVE